MLKKIILWVLIILLLLLVVLALTINPLLSWSSGKAFNKFAPDIIGTPTRVDAVAVSVYQGRVQIEDLFVGNPTGFTADRALSLDQMVLQIEPSSLLAPTLRVEEISIDNPTIVLEYANGKTNLGEIQKHLKSRRPAATSTDAEPAEPKGEGRKLSVNKIAVTDADVQIIVNGQSYKIESPDIILENVAPEGVTSAELSLLILEQLLRQIQIDVTQLAGQIGKQLTGELNKQLEQAGGQITSELNKQLEQAGGQITGELNKQLEQAGEQGRNLLKQLEEETGAQADVLRNLLGR